MSDVTQANPSDVPCHRCGYDVRAQPADGVCPECEASVADSRRLATIPRRPAWRDSDPRWRRRMLAGAWTLTFVPFVAILQAFGWDARVPIPTFYAVQGSGSLATSLVSNTHVYLTFCVGVVLLFSRERGRQVGRFDRLRGWGVVATYGVLVLGFVQVAFVPALVLLGISALCLSMPLKYHPTMTDTFVRLSVGYLRHGPHPGRLSAASLTACSAVVVLLACVPLFNALRSSGPKALAMTVLAPLAVASLVQTAFAGLYAVGLVSPEVDRSFFANPQVLAYGVALFGSVAIRADFVIEAVKWLAVLTIAVWLTIAQLATLRRRAGIR